MAGLRDLLVVAVLPLVAVGLHFLQIWIRNEYGRFMPSLRDLFVVAVFPLVAAGLYSLKQWTNVLQESIKQVSLREDVKESSNIKNAQYIARFTMFGKKDSADGVDIYVRWCKIDLAKDKWTIETVVEECTYQLSVEKGIKYRYANVKQSSQNALIIFIRIKILGEISVGKIWKLLKKGSDDASSTDGVDIRWSKFSMQKEIDKCTIEQVITLVIREDENKHLSMFLNASEKSLPKVKLIQDSLRMYNEILDNICGVLCKPKHAIVGSCAEGLTVSGSDTDMIGFAYTFKVFEYIKEPFNMDIGHCQSIRLPDERHPGYSKLSVISLDFDVLHKYTYTDEKDGKVYLKNNAKELVIHPDPSNVYSFHGPAFYQTIDPQTCESPGNPNVLNIFEIQEHLSADAVFCISSKQWPVEASEWITRKRAYNSPTRELIAQIINTGYLLAGVGSKESEENELQWRVSFNEAEQLIIESFNETQMHCFLLLKLMKNNCLSTIAGKNITSYTMKTVMFWCLEEKSDKYWQYSNLVSCFCFCVSKLKSFVEIGFIPNYFIRKRNQFVSKEFTSDIQIKTTTHLEQFLKDPDAGLSVIVPLYRKYADCPMFLMHYISQLTFIKVWLKSMLLVAYNDQYKLLFELYEGFNIKYISKRCNESLEKLTTIRYAQPLIKRLQNYMGVLQYLLIMEDKKKGDDSADSDARSKYSGYMKLSASGDLTHNTLRIATCYLDDDVKEECLNIIRTVTNLGGDFFMQTHVCRLKETIECSVKALQNPENVHDFGSVINIINDIDVIYMDPYRTTDKFEEYKANGKLLIGYDVLISAWKQSYFDVTFMQAELPVLPKPVALELCVDNNQKHVSFHSFLYGLLLEFLWHHKYGSGNWEKESVLQKMKNCVLKLPVEQKSRGFNLMAYCFSLQKDYCSGSRYLITSFNLNPVTQNVAHLYMKYISKQLLELSFDTTICTL